MSIGLLIGMSANNPSLSNWSFDVLKLSLYTCPSLSGVKPAILLMLPLIVILLILPVCMPLSTLIVLLLISVTVTVASFDGDVPPNCVPLIVNVSPIL